mmetsp:Transcript_143470/g.399953  ORF Transcript_143470/g.399953 Transcript_143470/m.399953 type:complete len:256 (+) Transcript_143470:116-883(+)
MEVVAPRPHSCLLPRHYQPSERFSEATTEPKEPTAGKSRGATTSFAPLHTSPRPLSSASASSPLSSLPLLPLLLPLASAFWAAPKPPSALASSPPFSLALSPELPLPALSALPPVLLLLASSSGSREAGGVCCGLGFPLAGGGVHASVPRPCGSGEAGPPSSAGAPPPPCSCRSSTANWEGRLHRMASRSPSDITLCASPKPATTADCSMETARSRRASASSGGPRPDWQGGSSGATPVPRRSAAANEKQQARPK